jgi:CRISPR/Cas system-associated endonuclease Cas1
MLVALVLFLTFLLTTLSMFHLPSQEREGMLFDISEVLKEYSIKRRQKQQREKRTGDWAGTGEGFCRTR